MKKLLSGPIKLPIPGPTFATAVSAPDKQVAKSNPVKDKPNAHKSVTIKNIPTKEETLKITSSVTGLLLYLGTTIACGDVINVRCRLMAFAKMEKRNVLMPPLVEPVQPPQAVSKKKNKTKNGPQSV